MKFFKFFLTIAIAAIGLFAVSCSSDDNKEEVKPTIVGTWELEAGTDVGRIVVFNADGTFTSNNAKGNDPSKGKYTIEGKTLKLVFIHEKDVEETTSATIEELTSTKLHVSFIDEDQKISEIFKRIK